ncbi:MAG: hypothetical protein ACK44F_10740 [Roseococcus sp.]
MTLTFDAFRPGQDFGAHSFTLDRAVFAAWTALFPHDPATDTMPQGMTAPVFMRAYAALLQPRPPGNVHGAQRVEIIRLPRLGETLRTAIACAGKERKGERRWVTLEGVATGAYGAPAFRARMTVLWAA